MVDELVSAFRDEYQERRGKKLMRDEVLAADACSASLPVLRLRLDFLL